MSLVKKELITIKAGMVELEGALELPGHAVGIVLFAHGSGSSRFSQRNNYVAAALHGAQIGSLLLDLLTTREDEEYQARFDVDLLTRRLDAASHWLRFSEATQALPLGLFGASTGAAAALQLAAMDGNEIAAVVSRGGRPDLAGHLALAKVKAPTLLIVGGDDDTVLALNRDAYALLQCEKRLEVVSGATHLFEEPGKLQIVSSLATDWFFRHFQAWQNERSRDGSRDRL